MGEIIRIEWQAKAPYTTWGLEIVFDPADEPVDLIKALAEIGFTEDNGFASRRLPPFPASVSESGKDEQEINVWKPGTAIFEGWTPDEAKANMRDANKVLRRFGLKAPKRRLTLQDLL